MPYWRDLLQRLFTDRLDLFVAIFLVLLGFLLGYLVARIVRRVLIGMGLDEAVEGTPFERTVQRFGTSTVSILASLLGLFVLVSTVLVASRFVGFASTDLLVTRFIQFLPRLFVAVLAIIVGLIVGEKAGMVVNERLRGIKLPETGVLASLVKYTVFFVAGLVALGELGVSTSALIVLLAAYAFGLVFLGGLAFRDLLAAAAAGVYLLLEQPYGIGDEIRIDGNRGIVQEVNIFVTHIENQDEEFIVSNHLIFRGGLVRFRDS